MFSWNFFHSGFFPFHPLLLILFDDLEKDDELLFWQFGGKWGFLTVFRGGTWRGGGDGDSCLIAVGPEYIGLSRHWSSLQQS